MVLSGGCEATDGGYIFQYNGPAGRNGWKCGGHGGVRKVPDGFLRTRDEVYGHKRVFAVCAPDNGPVQVTIKKQNGGDWTTASCDAGQVVVGGGRCVERWGVAPPQEQLSKTATVRMGTLGYVGGAERTKGRSRG